MCARTTKDAYVRHEKLPSHSGRSDRSRRPLTTPSVYYGIVLAVYDVKVGVKTPRKHAHASKRITVPAAFSLLQLCLLSALVQLTTTQTNILLLLISVGVGGMSRQQVLTAAQVGSILEEDEFVFSGSDDDFDASLDQDLDPIEREQGKEIACMQNNK